MAAGSKVLWQGLSAHGFELFNRNSAFAEDGGELFATAGLRARVHVANAESAARNVGGIDI